MKKYRLINRFIIFIIVVTLGLSSAYIFWIFNSLLDSYVSDQKKENQTEISTEFIGEQPTINTEETDPNRKPEYDISLDEDLQQFIWDTCNSYGYRSVGYEHVIAVIKKENPTMDINATNLNDDGSYDRGLIQLNDNTSYELAKDLEIENFDPYNPYDNIRVGIYYLNTMYNNFYKMLGSDEDTFVAVTMAFNRGGDRTKQLIEQNGINVAYEYPYVNQVLDYKMELELFNKFR
jgi:hypothetical protein